LRPGICFQHFGFAPNIYLNLCTQKMASMYIHSLLIRIIMIISEYYCWSSRMENVMNHELKIDQNLSIKAKFCTITCDHIWQRLASTYCIAQNFGGRKLWRIHPSRHFGGKNFGGWWKQFIIISAHWVNCHVAQ